MTQSEPPAAGFVVLPVLTLSRHFPYEDLLFNIVFLASSDPTTDELETDPKQGGTADGERGRYYQQHERTDHLILLTRSENVSYGIICHHHEKPAAANAHE
jgi:hypothetical protein